MPKPEQILIIDPPAELKFVGPFTNVVTSELRLKNPTNKNVLYKVRTTAPLRYCVRPNSGFIAPEQEVVIILSLQPLKLDLNEKIVDKFMVMSTVAPFGATESTEELWKNAEAGQIADTKLKCVFVMSHVTENEYVSKPAQHMNVPSGGDNFKVHQMTLQKEVPKFEVGETRSSNLDGESIPKPEQHSFLSSELEKLKSEHKKLSDEGMRLRNVSAPTAFQEESRVFKSMVQQEDKHFLDVFGTLPPVVYMFIMFLLGIVLGKFFM